MPKQALRNGVTTGTCSAAAAKAAAVQLIKKMRLSSVWLELPDQSGICLEVHWNNNEDGCFSRFGVQKDAGDDPDVTDQAWLYATVSFDQPEHKCWYQSEQYPNLYLSAGIGVGIVTKPGLLCPVGMPAINPVPQTMIFAAVGAVTAECNYMQKLYIWIDIPDGVQLAQKTFNPKLGIVGGLSILGTSGRVIPMSEDALIATIRLEIHMKAVAGNQKLLIAPGNYGEQFLKDYLPGSLQKAVKCSNFIYETMQILQEEGIRQILFAGHIGKLVKIAGGVKNTHSKYGDRRMEILADFINRMDHIDEQVKTRACQNVLAANTTEEALKMLDREGLVDQAAELLTAAVAAVMEQWVNEKVKVHVVMFSNVYGILGRRDLIAEQKEILWQEFCME